jgi:hypothetical protein
MKGRGANHLTIEFSRLEMTAKDHKKFNKKSVTDLDMNQVLLEHKPKS